MTRVSSSASKISERESPRTLGGVDPGRVEEVEGLVEQGAARHRELQRPVGLGRGSCRRPRRSRPAPSAPRLLLDLGDVDALQVEREAGRGQVDAEALASARRSGRRRRARGRAPGRRPRGSRRCSSRGRAAGRGRAGPGRRRRARSSASKVSPSRAVARSTASPPSSRACVEHLGAAAQLRERDAGRDLLVARCPRARRARPRGRRGRAWRGGRGSSRAPRPRPRAREQLAVEVGVAEADHRAVEPGRVERRLEHLDHLGGARPAPAAPISSTPAWTNSRIWPRCGRTAR